MKALKIADNLSLPLETATKTIGIIAQRRKGKTYTACDVAEEMHKVGIPWVALDPTGAWWGLRSSADGKKPGIPVIVFGGDHGDLPLERTAGAMIADLVIEHPGWYILDFSHFESKAAERELATDFAERFYRRKVRNKAPMHLFVDEADMFAPQQSPAGDKRMLGAFEAIVRRGGIRGIGTTLITQRAAVINKNILEQIDMLIALRTVGPNDRKAIAGYVNANGTPEQQEQLLGSIASLELGEAWIWEPGADLFKRVKIRKRETFNSSATPKVGDKPVVPATLAKVDLDKLRDKMAATIAVVAENDPDKLRQRIRELERRKPDVEMHQVEVVPHDVANMVNLLRHDLEALTMHLDEFDRRLGKYAPASDTDSQFRKIQKRVKEGTISDQAASFAVNLPDKSTVAKAMKPAIEAVRKSLDPVTDTRISPGEKAILVAAGQYGAGGVTRSALTVLTGYKRSSRNTYISRLTQRGFIDTTGDRIFINEDGRDALGDDYDPLPTGEALRNRLLAELPTGEKAILDYLIKIYPASTSRDSISEVTGYLQSSRNTYISRMAAKEIIKVDGQNIRASDNLFEVTLRKDGV